MSIGSNDLLQRALPFLVRMSDEKHPLSLREWQQLTVEGIAAIVEFQENLPKILEEVRKETSSPIIVYTIYNPFPPGHTLHSMAKLFIDPMNGIIAQTVASKGDPAILLADAASRFEGHQLEWVRLSERDVHPTQEGQRVLADLAKEALAFSRINPENRE